MLRRLNYMAKRIRKSVKKNKYATEQPMANQLIDKFGGNNKVADLLDISPSAVSWWRENGIPKFRMLQLQILKPELAGRPSI